MTNQIPEKSIIKPTAGSIAGQIGREGGHDDHQVHLLLLKRQISELERRFEAVLTSERKARADLLTALGEKQAFTQEQARLQEELAARERTVSEIFRREAGLRSEITALRAKLHQLETELSAPMAQAARLPVVEMNLARLSSHVAKRAHIIGFIAEQMREQRRRDLAMRASIAGSVGPSRGHQLVEAGLATRRESARLEKKLHDERWQAWLAVQSAPRGAPSRRNRPEKHLERILSRLGPLGGALALSRSGLWNSAFQTDSRPGAPRASLLSYAGARPSPDANVKSLFDQRFYLEKNPSVATIRRAPLLHYLTHGDRENRSPHPLVDVIHYRAANPHELASSGLTVLQHFLFSGAAKGLNPHPLFDVRYYVSQLSDPHDFTINPLVHYLRTGWRRGFNPHPLFDNDRYLEKNPDVAELMIAPLLHYVKFGATQGRDPHVLFSTQWYQTRYPDVRESGQNPLVHFLDTALAERRDPRPDFDSGYYMRQAPDSYSNGLDPL